MLSHIFGSALTLIASNLGTINCNIQNLWVWYPMTHKTNLASNVYHLLNRNGVDSNPWTRWKKIWVVKTAPRVKHFLWLVFKGPLAIYEYLHSLNLGPKTMCLLCGLQYESSEHLLFNCIKAQLCLESCWLSDWQSFLIPWWHLSWKLTNESLYTRVFQIYYYSSRLAYLESPPNLSIITQRAISFAKDHYHANDLNLGRKLLLNNFTDDAGLFLFYSSTWSVSTNLAPGVGFFVVDSNYDIVFARCSPLSSCNKLDADLQALVFA